MSTNEAAMQQMLVMLSSSDFSGIEEEPRSP